MSSNNETKNQIISQAKKLFADQGYEGFTMRTLAKKLNLAQSVVYHYFTSKDELLSATFNVIKKDLGSKRKKIELTGNLYKDLEGRINFQFEHAQEIIFILKYYLHFRTTFTETTYGYVPQTAYLHIYEVLEKATESGEIGNIDLEKEAKIITHAINGFVMEYYPSVPMEPDREKITKDITDFIFRSLACTNNPSL